MKKIKLRVFLMTVLMVIGFGSMSIMAKDINVKIDGNPLVMTQKPVVKDGVTLVPMRSIFEALGAEIEWDAEGQAIVASKDAKLVKLILYGSEAFILDDEETSFKRTKLSYPPISLNDTTYVPLRFVGEVLGAEVKWDAKNQEISITSGPDKQIEEQSIEELLQALNDLHENTGVLAVYGGYFLDFPGKIVGPQIEHCVKNTEWKSSVINDAEYSVSVTGIYNNAPISIYFTFDYTTGMFSFDKIVKNGRELSLSEANQIMVQMLKHNVAKK